MPTRGSRFDGLLSMTITSVSGSGLRVHAMRDSSERAPNTPSSNLCVPLRPLQEIIDLRIRDFAQHCRALRSGCGRKIAGHALPGLICEDGESNRFLAFGGQPEVVGGLDRQF